MTFFLPTSGVLRHLVRNPRLSLPSFAIPGLFSSRLHATPNLNPIFHITSRKSYSATGQEAARRTKVPARGNGGTFLSSLCLSSPFAASPPSPPVLHPDAAQSKTISEHIAQVRLLSPSLLIPTPLSFPDLARFLSFFLDECRYVVPLIRPSWKT